MANTATITIPTDADLKLATQWYTGKPAVEAVYANVYDTLRNQEQALDNSYRKGSFVDGYGHGHYEIEFVKDLSKLISAKLFYANSAKYQKSADMDVPQLIDWAYNVNKKKLELVLPDLTVALKKLNIRVWAQDGYDYDWDDLRTIQTEINRHGTDSLKWVKVVNDQFVDLTPRDILDVYHVMRDVVRYHMYLMRDEANSINAQPVITRYDLKNYMLNKGLTLIPATFKGFGGFEITTNGRYGNKHDNNVVVYVRETDDKEPWSRCTSLTKDGTSARINYNDNLSRLLDDDDRNYLAHYVQQDVATRLEFPEIPYRVKSMTGHH